VISLYFRIVFNTDENVKQILESVVGKDGETQEGLISGVDTQDAHLVISLKEKTKTQ